MSGEYRVGFVSDLVGVAESEFDPTLVSMFTSTQGAKVRSIQKDQPAFPSLPPAQARKAKNLFKSEDVRKGRKQSAFQIQTISTPPIDSFLARAKLSQPMKAKGKQNFKIVEKPKKVKILKKSLPVEVEEEYEEMKDKVEEYQEMETEGINTTHSKASNKKKDKTEKLKKSKTLKSSKVEETKVEEKLIAEENNDQVKVAVKEEEAGSNSALETLESSTDNKPKQKSLIQHNTPKDKDPELEARTVYVGNVPKELPKKKLERMFKEFGKIESIRFRCGAPDKPSKLKKVAINKKELHPDRNSFAAYIRYSSREEAETAKNKASGLEVMEHHLTTDLADNSLKKDNKKGIFVGNLHLVIQDDELWDFFKDCGKIESVRVIRDRASGLGKGFGYVNFEDRASVELALKKDGLELKKRAMRISRCVKKLKIKEESAPRTDKKRPESGAFRRISNKQKNNPTEGDKTIPINKKNNYRDGDKNMSSKKRNTISQGLRQRLETFGGDRTAEIGKLKRLSKKPNKVEQKKARFAKQLSQTVTRTGNNQTFQRYFNPTGDSRQQGQKQDNKKFKKSKPKHQARKAGAQNKS